MSQRFLEGIFLFVFEVSLRIFSLPTKRNFPEHNLTTSTFRFQSLLQSLMALLIKGHSGISCVTLGRLASGFSFLASKMG